MVGLSTVKEFYDFVKTRKKFWLFPIILIILIFGGIIILTESSVVAPFIYALF
jgi:hypothetical protein